VGIQKGSVVKWARPENEQEAAQRFRMLDDVQGLTPDDAVKIEEIQTRWRFSAISTVALKHVVSADSEFACRVCGKECNYAPADPVGPDDKPICEDCCEEHEYEYDKVDRASYCKHCFKRSDEVPEDNWR